MARASLVLARRVPAYSSGVSVGINRSSCPSDVIRCLSCQRQSFQSESLTSDQKPRPAGTNLFSDSRALGKGGSSPLPEEVSFIVRELYFGSPTCQVAASRKIRGIRESGNQGMRGLDGAVWFANVRFMNSAGPRFGLWFGGSNFFGLT